MVKVRMEGRLARTEKSCLREIEQLPVEVLAVLSLLRKSPSPVLQ